MIAATTRALVDRLVELLTTERGALADFLATLADFDRQRRWEELGYANLYDFLVRELGMSKGTAFYRKIAVELVQRYPEVLEPIRDGRLCITAVHALSKAITPESRAEVLPRFFRVSKQEAKAVSAQLAPALEVPRREVVTTVRVAPSLDLGLQTWRTRDGGRLPDPVQAAQPRPRPPGLRGRVHGTLSEARPDQRLETRYGSTVATYFGAFFSIPMMTADFTGLWSASNRIVPVTPCSVVVCSMASRTAPGVSSPARLIASSARRAAS